ncbi:hypothetical protein [Mesorhizobium sp.]|uniref:hypothetical protein n=1 Tax=Mesorhizobium sp. TaxID=1871066 RepID=UPI000FE90E72|nr:hypothetical protein [Mesorhizobium sp.]RWA63135.1 MAG: hypothetical protein EOQ27_12975 [Mesorhizobium sp.]
MSTLFFLEAFLLFVAPGPTNALLMAGAAKRQKAIALLVAQACGYGIAAACWFALRPSLPSDAIQVLKLVAAVWLAILGVRLIGIDRIDASEDGDGLYVLVTTALNPKAFIYCLATVPVDARPYDLGLFWIVLLVTTAASGSMWLLLGRRLSGGEEMADRIAGAALVVFALTLLRPLLAIAAT